MGQVLYRKYRSKSLDEIVGQEHITTTLKQALAQGRISHAYLFTGPRGVGKTSVARILAHEINGIPYRDDSMHLDIIEIDAASNRRIDEIRELRDKVYIAPTSATYKVYIIDEVHMLTREAFNALLKTLEEPPEHAVFILATTDAHKVPETIISRTQRYTFKPVSIQAVSNHLGEIAKTEGIKISPEALELIAAHGEGSFRDSISLLDQAASHHDKLELTDIQHLLGIAPQDSLQNLLDSITNTDASQAMNQLNGLYEQGFQAATIANQLSKLLRQNVIQTNDTKILDLLTDLLEVPKAHLPDRYLEICILRATIDGLHTSSEQSPKPAARATSVEPEQIAPIEAPHTDQQIDAQPANEDIPKPKPSTSKKKTTSDAHDLWPAVLTALKQQYNTLYGVIRMAEPSFQDNKLVLAFGFSFHQKRVAEAKNTRIISEIMKDLTGRDYAVECLVEKGVTPPKYDPLPTAPAVDVKPDISSISNIFGGAELLES
jgi:DNA polymerase-3 subunit gamma/tau